MIKTFDHAIIYNGEYYAANTPIEICEEEPETSENEIPEEQKAQAETTEAEEKAVKNGRKRAGRKPKSKSAN